MATSIRLAMEPSSSSPSSIRTPRGNDHSGPFPDFGSEMRTVLGLGLRLRSGLCLSILLATPPSLILLLRSSASLASVPPSFSKPRPPLPPRQLLSASLKPHSATSHRNGDEGDDDAYVSSIAEDAAVTAPKDRTRQRRTLRRQIQQQQSTPSDAGHFSNDYGANLVSVRLSPFALLLSPVLLAVGDDEEGDGDGGVGGLPASVAETVRWTVEREAGQYLEHLDGSLAFGEIRFQRLALGPVIADTVISYDGIGSDVGEGGGGGDRRRRRRGGAETPDVKRRLRGAVPHGAKRGLVEGERTSYVVAVVVLGGGRATFEVPVDSSSYGLREAAEGYIAKLVAEKLATALRNGDNNDDGVGVGALRAVESAEIDFEYDVTAIPNAVVGVDGGSTSAAVATVNAATTKTTPAVRATTVSVENGDMSVQGEAEDGSVSVVIEITDINENSQSVAGELPDNEDDKDGAVGKGGLDIHRTPANVTRHEDEDTVSADIDDANSGNGGRGDSYASSAARQAGVTGETPPSKFALPLGVGTAALILFGSILFLVVWGRKRARNAEELRRTVTCALDEARRCGDCDESERTSDIGGDLVGDRSKEGKGGGGIEGGTAVARVLSSLKLCRDASLTDSTTGIAESFSEASGEERNDDDCDYDAVMLDFSTSATTVPSPAPYVASQSSPRRANLEGNDDGECSCDGSLVSDASSDETVLSHHLRDIELRRVGSAISLRKDMLLTELDAEV